MSAALALPSAPHVLVTGTSGAIGGAIARVVRERRPGARLSLVDRELEASRSLAASLGGHARVIGADLSHIEALPELVREAESELGPIDGLVNCAGIMDVRRVDGFDWQRIMLLLAIDLVAPLRLQQLVLSGMLERGAGFVVNVSSMAGRLPIKGCAYYGAAKAGLAMASEVAHAELATRGVQVVTVYPGPVASALERGAREQLGNTRIARAIPMGTASVLAERVMRAIEHKHARVVYPSIYELGFRAVELASRVTLGFGPDPA